MHHSDQVWHHTARALSRRRLRRRIATVTLSAAPLVLLWFAWNAAQPTPALTPATVDSPEFSAPTNAPRLAVLVPDGPRFRLELWSAADLGEDSLDLTLEPLVRALPPADPDF
jgi:hypothetical protein